MALVWEMRKSAVAMRLKLLQQQAVECTIALAPVAAIVEKLFTTQGCRSTVTGCRLPRFF